MATGSCQAIMKAIATTGIWPSCQPSAVVIGGKNGAEALLMRIRPFSVRWCRPEAKATAFSDRILLFLYREEYDLEEESAAIH